MSDDDKKIPVVREDVEVGRREEVTGRVRIEKHVHERIERLDEEVRVEGIDVERVPIDRYVDEAPPVREEEDGTIVVPRVREVLVVERRLLLEEEVRIRRTARTERERLDVPLRAEEIVVRRDHNQKEAHMAKTVVALYENREHSDRAYDELLNNGVSRDQVETFGDGFRGDRDRQRELHQRLRAGGVEESHARWYVDGVEHGGHLIIVNTNDQRAQQIAVMLRRHGALQPGTALPGRAGAPRPQAGQERRHVEGQRRGEEGRFDVVEEEVRVGKEVREEGGVRVEKHVSERPVEEDVELRRERVNIERRPVDRPLRPGEADEAFREGSMEFEERREEPVIEKRPHVVEEVRVGKEVESETRRIHETARRTDIDIERLGAGEFNRIEQDLRAEFHRTHALRGRTWEDFRPAYELGYRFGSDTSWRDREWSEVEPRARETWESRYTRHGTWNEVRDAVHEGWRRTRATA